MKKWKKEKKNQDLGEGIELLDQGLEDDVELLIELQRNKNKKKKKKQWSSDEEDEIPNIEESIEEVEIVPEEVVQEEEEEGEETGEEKSHAQLKREKKNQKKKEKSKQQTKQVKPNILKCNVCGEVFETKNKLFQHLKSSGHESSVDLTLLPQTVQEEVTKRKGKKKK
jgi:DnaJ homolog subfamily A member 5